MARLGGGTGQDAAAAAGCNVAVLRAAGGRRGGGRSHIRVLLRHLAAADLLVTVVVMPLDAIWNITLQWRAGDLACRLLMYLRLLAMYASAFVTVVISLDRQAAILRPLAIARARCRNRAMLRAAWMLSAALAVPQLFLFHTITLHAPHNFTQCTTHGSFPQPWHETLYNMLSFSCLFLLPLLIMVCCYTRILLEISRRMGSSLFSSRDVPLRCSGSNIPRARLRTLKMSLVIVSSFILCWTPYYLLGLWYWFCPRAMQQKVPPSLSHILFIFGLFNACLDPITYGLFTIPFRRRCGCPCGHSSEPEPPSPATGSFHCSASSLRGRQGMGGTEGPHPPIELGLPTGAGSCQSSAL
ncbi:gonadotropin-releasing hormone II receptor isoform X1 [Gallus gallus]|uniref:gonadotropin-releasing hormone II receptor isoform X1 n=1 Tax=Gallus gallus TaxID=9031 RepID=UPI001AEA4354|nr:gonadotropin-releasing hormone II receptor isoform X1 [Gallus gallus]